MKSIAIFNNKGGVGKTTLLCNLAAHYAIKKHQKVVVIDADPQSNATLYMLDDNTAFETYDKGSGTLNDIFVELRKGLYFNKPIPIIKSPRFKVDIVPGDPQISTFEDFLSKDWFDSIQGQPRAMRTTTIFVDLLAKLEVLGYDLAFFDLSPSLGAINRSVLLSCDYFLLPMSSDIFSLKAINNIKYSLQKWQSDFEKGIENHEINEGSPYMVNEEKITSNLRFSGYVTQQYIAKMKDGQRQAVGAFEKIIKQIPKSIEKQLITHFNPSKPIAFDAYNLGEIPNLYSLIPLSQLANAPIFDLGKDDGIVGAHFTKVKEYGDLLGSIATKLTSNISTL